MPSVGTGGNSTPLGKTAPMCTKKMNESSMLNPSYMKSGQIPAIKSKEELEDEAQQSERKKRRKTRWANDDREKILIPGMPTFLPCNLSKSQEEAYILQLQIEELSRRLRTGDLGIPLNPDERSPSPEPIYNSDGKRLNTREFRTRKKLEDDRHTLIQRMMCINMDYKPPLDYKPPVVRVSDKVMIPQETYPDINFVGLLIGPRGNTLKAMEKETGAKIIIRGKGSVKEGKVGRKDGQPLPGEDEPLHAYVTAHNIESVKKAVDKIKEIIRQGIEVPEGQNDLRRNQLRELALLNGTLRESDGPRCTNCGAITHKSWQCPEKPNITNTVVCTICGGAGHISKDCMQKRPGEDVPTLEINKAKIDEEYMSLMAELGEGPVPSQKDGMGTDMSRFMAAAYVPAALFAPRVAPRPVMAPPPQPPGQNEYPDGVKLGNSQSWSQPPTAMATPPAPPGVTGWKGLPSATAAPPPPNLLHGPPTNAPFLGTSSTQWSTGLPHWHQAPPPPPIGIPMSHWQQPPPPPGPVPPPRPSLTPGQPLPWQQDYSGMPPPLQSAAAATSAAPSSSTATIDLNALAQAGLPNLLAAPPPPPPS